MASDDEDECEKLRLAALASIHSRKKQNVSSDVQSNRDSVLFNISNNYVTNPPSYTQSVVLPIVTSDASSFMPAPNKHFRGNRMLGNKKFWNKRVTRPWRNPNLIAIVPINEEDSAPSIPSSMPRSSLSLAGSKEVPKLILPQDRFSKTLNIEPNKTSEDTTKFSRFKDSNSGNESDDSDIEDFFLDGKESLDKSNSEEDEEDTLQKAIEELESVVRGDPIKTFESSQNSATKNFDSVICSESSTATANDPVVVSSNIKSPTSVEEATEEKIFLNTEIENLQEALVENEVLSSSKTESNYDLLLETDDLLPEPASNIKLLPRSYSRSVSRSPKRKSPTEKCSPNNSDSENSDSISLSLSSGSHASSPHSSRSPSPNNRVSKSSNERLMADYKKRHFSPLRSRSRSTSRSSQSLKRRLSSRSPSPLVRRRREGYPNSSTSKPNERFHNRNSRSRFRNSPDRHLYSRDTYNEKQFYPSRSPRKHSSDSCDSKKLSSPHSVSNARITKYGSQSPEPHLDMKCRDVKFSNCDKSKEFSIDRDKLVVRDRDKKDKSGIPNLRTIRNSPPYISPAALVPEGETISKHKKSKSKELKTKSHKEVEDLREILSRRRAGKSVKFKSINEKSPSRVLNLGISDMDNISPKKKSKKKKHKKDKSGDSEKRRVFMLNMLDADISSSSVSAEKKIKTRDTSPFLQQSKVSVHQRLGFSNLNSSPRKEKEHTSKKSSHKSKHSSSKK